MFSATELKSSAVGEFYRRVRSAKDRADDAVRVLSFRFRRPRSGTKFWVLDSLRKLTSARCLVETGTYYGDTSALAAKAFEAVHTIELDPELAALSRARLKRYDNVHSYQGDAVECLPTILERSDVSEAILFLDAHFSGGTTAAGEILEPAIEELEVAARHSEKLRAIVIDDFRSFGVRPGFPSKAALFSALERLFPAGEYDLTVHLDQVLLVPGGLWF